MDFKVGVGHTKDVSMADAGSKTIVEEKPKAPPAKEQEEDLYTRMKELENELAMLQIQEGKQSCQIGRLV